VLYFIVVHVVALAPRWKFSRVVLSMVICGVREAGSNAIRMSSEAVGECSPRPPFILVYALL